MLKIKNLMFILLGVVVGTVFYACGSGSKRPNYNDFPIRSNDFSAWMQCSDGDKLNVCKYECTKYKKNICEDGHERIVRMRIEKALNDGYVLISKRHFLQLVMSKK